MTNKQIAIGGVAALVLATAVGLAVGQRQAKASTADTITAMKAETAELRSKLQQTEADLAAMVRTAKKPQIKVSPTTPAPAAPATAEPSDLQEQLAAKDQEIAALKTQIAQAPEPRQENRGRQDWQQRMEEMQKENPEEYQRIQEERRQRTQDFAQRTTDRFEFFSSVSAEGLPDEYAANHEALLERMQFFSHAMNQIAADPDSEASHELRRDLRENMRGTGDMLAMEREVLVSDLFSGLGVSDDKSSEAIEYLEYIDQMTSMGGFFGRGGGPGGGRGGR